MTLRILVVGAGSVGGYFGARLVQAGRDVTFLVRPARRDQVLRDGLRIVSPHGDATLRPALITAGEIAGPYDVVLLSVKAYALDRAIADFAGAVGAATMILPVLNGLGHIDRLVERFGEEPVLGGVCLVATDLDEQGRIAQLADIQRLTYGERSGEITPRLRALDAALGGAGFDTLLSPDIMQAMWEKWVQLASLGAATCLLRGTIGDIVAAPGGAELTRTILEDCAVIAAACGHVPPPPFLAQQSAALTTPGSGLTSSMYRDLRKGAPVEADQILGDLIERGRALGVASPLLSAAYASLRIYGAAVSRSGSR